MIKLCLKPLVLLVATAISSVASGLECPPVFADHMVLQQGLDLPVWGTAPADAEVVVTFGDVSRRGKADSNGKWQVRLPKQEASILPQKLVIECGDERRTFRDVLIGEVWLCAGQSNMEFPLSRAASAKTALPNADLPTMRLLQLEGAARGGSGKYTKEHLARMTPEKFCEGTWQVCTEQSAAPFSAVGYFFGRELHEKLDVPIGLISPAIGGTPAEAWIRRDAIAADPLLGPIVQGNWIENEHCDAWCRERAISNFSRAKSEGLTIPGDELGPNHSFKPAFMWQAGVEPLVPFAIRGALWYQGESNAEGPRRVAQHLRLFPLLIRDWRTQWGQGDFPFLFVQLPGMGRPHWPAFRESQRRSLDNVPNTGMAVAIDLGHPSNVHPTRKRPVGLRLARWALGTTYEKKDVEISGPLMKSLDIEGHRAVLTFDHVGTGLTTSDGQRLRHFETAGDDGEFHSAEASIVGDTVIVTSSKVWNPRHVRYAWTPYPDPPVNFFNQSGLPAAPFTTVSQIAPTPNPSPADGGEGLQTGFENATAGSLKTLETPIGAWRAEEGNATIHDRHAHTGKRSLRILGGDKHMVELMPTSDIHDAHQMTFWAERWTRNAPFEFRIDRWHDGKWHELYRGDQEIRVGGFLARVVVGLQDKPTKKFRFVCTAPQNSGVLIDDIALVPARPMELRRVTTRQQVTPVLIGRERSPVLQIRIDTVGNLEPIRLSEISVSTEGTDSLDDVESVSIFASGNDSQLPPVRTAQADSEPFLWGMPQPPRSQMIFRGKQQLVHGSNYFWVCVKLKESANIDHRVDAGCDYVRLSNLEKKFTPDVASPAGSKRLGIALRKAGDDRSRCYRIPGLATTNQGTLIAVYDVRWRGCGDLPGDIDVGMSRSTDGGRTWQPMQVIMDTGNDPKWSCDGIGDPSVLVDRETGTIWVAALWSHGERGWFGSGPGLLPAETGQLMMVKSEDDGVTWSEPINVTTQIKKPDWCLLLQGPGKGITMRDGTIVFPAQYQDSRAKRRVPHSTIIFSTDHGQTWRIGSGAFDATTEAQVVELEPGVLMLNCRYDRQNRRVVMVTHDMGETWIEHPTSRKALPEPGACMASLISTHSGKEGESGTWLLFSNPNIDHPPRRQMTIKAARDNGETWPKEHQLLLDEGKSAGYSCMTMIDAETVGILYESSQAHLVFQRVPLKEIIGSGPPPATRP